MNVLKLLSDELNVKDWTLEEKVRYLYLRSCQLFSYDERYIFSELKLSDKIDVNEILNNSINLENVQDNRVVCTSYALVISNLMKELLNIDCKSTGNLHRWNSICLGDKTILADATLYSDLARVKMNLTTEGYTSMQNDYNFPIELKDIDKKIGYIKEEYENHYLEQKKLILQDSGFEIKNDYDLYMYVIERIHLIKELFEKYKLNNFNDCEFCISYLIRHFINSTIPRDRISLFDETKNGIQCVDLYYFKLRKEILYFALQQIENKFYFYELTDSDACNYIKTLKGINKGIMY